jgi:N utilization substance protein A
MEALDVDEVIAQLLATEGFASAEEVAFVDPSEIAHIEGFDEDTATEIQTRAREYLAKIEAERDAKIEGVTTAMMVAFGEAGIKTIEDLADCATDELTGWTERKKEKDGEVTKHKGALEGFDVGRKEAEAMILAARVEAGWIKPEDIAPPEPEATDEEATPETADAGAAAPAKT